ncbi:MAG: hypothetical protein LBO09_03465 [Candidatus Peribacteria bacterium]|nr:hypothetical protein [Candidatus Peribacteria bacterium]
MINQLFLNHQQARKGKKEWGYVIGVEILSQTILTVRPWLHCPEIDEVDDILLEQVVSCEEKKIKIGSRVEYII